MDLFRWEMEASHTNAQHIYVLFILIYDIQTRLCAFLFLQRTERNKSLTHFHLYLL